MGISRLLSCHISWKYGPDYAILECRMEFYRNFRHSAYPSCIRPMFRAYIRYDPKEECYEESYIRPFQGQRQDLLF